MSDVKSVASHQVRIRLPPEVQIALFGFLLNYPWEMLQTPFFAEMPDMRHWDAVKVCSQATLGDAGILVLAYWAGVVVQRTRAWAAHPRKAGLIAFLLTGLGVTVVFEWLATEVWDRWQYGPSMPTLPLLGTGITPLLQWLVLPPLVVWIVRRQMLGSAALASGTPRGVGDRDDGP